MLLSHASSMNNDPDSFYWFNYSVDPPITWYPYPWLNEYLFPGGNHYVEEIWDDENPPGTEAEYANINFVLISYLVELISGEPFLEFCEENILIPLGMANSSFNLSFFDIDNVAIPYHYYNGEYYTINNTVDLGYVLPDIMYYRMLHYPVGGFYTSVSDLSHFMIVHMNGGVYNGIRILEEDTVDEMHKIQPPDVGYGLAWYYTGRKFGKIFSGHEGDVPGYHNSMLVHYPDNDDGVIFFVNGGRYNTAGVYIAFILRNILFLKADLL
jgi:CubicO group peptidase (beta-lactamase class C family)